MSQDQQNETERSSKSVASILVWIFTVAVVYLLSFGPAVGLYDRTGPARASADRELNDIVCAGLGSQGERDWSPARLVVAVLGEDAGKFPRSCQNGIFNLSFRQAGEHFHADRRYVHDKKIRIYS